MTAPRRIRFPPGATEQDIRTAVDQAGAFELGTEVVIDLEHDPACPRLAGLACCCDASATVTIFRRDAGWTP